MSIQSNLVDDTYTATFKNILVDVLLDDCRGFAQRIGLVNDTLFVEFIFS